MNTRYTMPLMACFLLLGCSPKGEPAAGDAGEAKPAEVKREAVEDAVVPAGEDDTPRPKAVEQPPLPERPSTGFTVFPKQRLSDTGTTLAHWRIDPTSKWVSAAFAGECRLWALETGEYQGSVPTGGPTDRCQSGSPLEALPWSRGTSSLERPGASTRLELDETQFELAGTKLRAQAAQGQRYLGASFDPKGERLAVLVAQGSGLASTLQLWSVAEGRLVRELELSHALGDFGGQSREAVGVWLHWSDQSLAVALDVQINWGKERESFAFVHVLEKPGEPNAEVVSVDLTGEMGESTLGLYLDPQRAVLVALLEGVIPDDGADYQSVEILSLASGQVYGWLRDDYLVDRGTVPPRTWSDAVGSSAWNLSESDTGYEEDLGWHWSITSLTSLPDGDVELREESSFVPIDALAGALELSLVGRGKVVSAKQLCLTADGGEREEDEERDEDEDEHLCPDRSALPSGCELVDASWDLERLLLTCNDQWLSAPNPRFGGQVDRAASLELATGTLAPHAVLWSPEQLAIWTQAEGLRVIGVEGKKVRVRSFAALDGLRRALLDEELGRALVLEGGVPRVVNLAAALGGEAGSDAGLGPKLDWKTPIEHAAFGPGGARLALAGGGRVAVFDTATAAPLSSWSVAELTGIAFRQDGAVLYLGATRPIPELAYDPATGQALVSAQLPAEILDRLALAGMDPSWRWSIDRDGTLLRALDGQALLVYERDRVLAESGLYAGPAKSFERYAMREGELGAPVSSAQGLPKTLERPNLLRAFLTGQSLP